MVGLETVRDTIEIKKRCGRGFSHNQEEPGAGSVLVLVPLLGWFNLKLLGTYLL